MENFTLAIDRLFIALDRARCRMAGCRHKPGDPIGVAHRLLNTLPVTRKVTQEWSWSAESREARKGAMAQQSLRMKGRYAA